MVPVQATGRGFKGAAAYLLHDKSADTQERVAWTHTENMHTDDPERSWRAMAWLASSAQDLKRQHANQNGQDLNKAMRGRKLDKPVLTLSLSWGQDERPSREEMIAAGKEAMKRLGMEDHQALYVAHNDTEHPHVHILANRVHPQTGKAAPLSRSRETLSRWAEEYERTQGQIRCAKRVENNRARDAGQKVVHSQEVIARAWAQADTPQAFQAALAEQGYILAQGDRRGFVVVDPHGKAHNPVRHLPGVSAKAFQERMGDLAPAQCPRVAQVRQGQSEAKMARAGADTNGPQLAQDDRRARQGDKGPRTPANDPGAPTGPSEAQDGHRRARGQGHRDGPIPTRTTDDRVPMDAEGRGQALAESASAPGTGAEPNRAKAHGADAQPEPKRAERAPLPPDRAERARESDSAGHSADKARPGVPLPEAHGPAGPSAQPDGRRAADRAHAARAGALEEPRRQEDTPAAPRRGSVEALRARMAQATRTDAPAPANDQARATQPPCPPPPRASQGESAQAEVALWANRLRAERQDRQLAERAELGRAHQRALLHKDRSLEAFYGPTQREAQAELDAIRQRQARAGMGALLYRLGGQAKADAARAEALDKSLANIAWRQTEARTALRTAQAKEVEALLLRHGKEREADEQRFAHAQERGRVPDDSCQATHERATRMSWEGAARERAQGAQTPAPANDLGQSGPEAGPWRTLS